MDWNFTTSETMHECEKKTSRRNITYSGAQLILTCKNFKENVTRIDCFVFIVHNLNRTMNLYRKDRPNLKKEMGSASFPSEAVGSLKREQEQAHLFSFLTKIEIRLHTPDLALTKFPTFLKQESASIAKQKALKTNTYRFNTIQR